VFVKKDKIGGAKVIPLYNDFISKIKRLEFHIVSQAILCPVKLVCNCVKSAVSRKVVPFREIGFGIGGGIDAGYWELLS
jgi:hypothetical protein